MAENVDDTILNMVNNLKSTLKTPRNNFEFTPLKPTSSSNSNDSIYDEPTPVIKRFKMDNKLDLSYIGSPREVRRIRADLVEARNTIKSLEGRITHMHSVRKQMQLMFEDENKTLKRQNEYDKKSIEELENQLQIIRKREIDIKNQLSEVTNKYELLKINTKEDVQIYERNLSDLKEQSRQMELEENSMIPTLERRIAELETMLEAAEEDAEAQKKLSEELGKRLREDNAVQKGSELKEQELLQAKLKIKELEYTLKSFGEFQDLAKSQSHKLSRYIDLEKENGQLLEENLRLKDQIRNKLILEEEVFDLKNRLVKYKDYEKQLSELQIQEAQNVMYLNEWRAVARGICESMESDSELTRQLRGVVERLQQQELRLTAQKVELESQLKAITHDAKVAKSEVEKSQKLIKELKQTGEQKLKLFHRAEKKLLLVSRERDSYRLQLDSYERDLTIYGNDMSTLVTSSQVQSQKERIDNLVKIIADYEDVVAKLENDLKNAEPNINNDVIPLRAEQITRLKDEVQRLKFENDKLRERRDELEIQLEAYLDGQDTLAGGKILHLANNPLIECLIQKEKQKFQEEVDRLKRKIKNLEEGIESSKLADGTLDFKEVATLKEQLKSQESQTRLLKDYCKSQMQEFRKVIYQLLGYKIDRTEKSLYKLSSVYAENPDDLLCFQVNKDGDLNLMESEFSKTLESMINLHLRHQKSIPVFLSAITIDLFNNTTMTNKSYNI